MTTSATSAGRLARSAGPTVQDVLAEEAARPVVPTVLQTESPVYFGVAELSQKRYPGVPRPRGREDVAQGVADGAAKRTSRTSGTNHHDIADDSIVVVRVTPEQIKAYHNSCLHRGTQLVRGQTSVASLTCQFHGWSWNLDGTMKNLPCQWDFPQVDKGKLTLPEVKVDTWDGWVFVNLDPESGTLAEYLGR
jgi:nitrite reductase/ring-hydroxylating ferredoxin subunit